MDEKSVAKINGGSNLMPFLRHFSAVRPQCVYVPIDQQQQHSLTSLKWYEWPFPNVIFPRNTPCQGLFFQLVSLNKAF